MSAKVKHISYYLPEKTFSNKEFFTLFPDGADNTTLQKIGIETRQIATDELASDLAVKAANKLFVEHNINPAEIDFVIFCAQEFDYYTPTTACVIQSRLKIPNHAGALDINLGCSGFVYCVGVAKGIIEAMGVKNVLLLTASTLTKKIHALDKSSRFVFGDGAAATLISHSDVDSIGPFLMGTKGAGHDKIIVKDGGARNPITTNSSNLITDDYGNSYSDGSFYMNGTSIFVFGLKTVPKLVVDLLEKSRLEKEDIDLYIFHQANEFLLRTLQKKLDIPDEKFFIYMKNVGNTVSSTIPIALYHAIKINKVQPGQKVMIVGFGVGLSWAGTVITI